VSEADMSEAHDLAIALRRARDAWDTVTRKGADACGAVADAYDEMRVALLDEIGVCADVLDQVSDR
jgi:CHAD domain-containing protein